jgi:hypothetical protein
VEVQQRGRLQNNGRAKETSPANEKSAYAGDETIHSAQVGRSFAPAIQDQQLLPDRHGFGDHATDSTQLRQPNHDDHQMHQKDQELTHSGNRTKIRQPLILAAFRNSPSTGSAPSASHPSGTYLFRIARPNRRRGVLPETVRNSCAAQVGGLF